jgi:hypothetical protein
MRIRVPLALTVLTLIASAVWPVRASARTYDVFTCTQPNGAAAPIDGWTPSTDNASIATGNECGQGGFMFAGIVGYAAVPVFDEAVWAFVPPPGLAIHEATLYRYFSNSDLLSTGAASGFESLTAPYRHSPPFDRCTRTQGCAISGPFRGPISSENEVKVPARALMPERGGPAAGIYTAAGCTSSSWGPEHCEGAVNGLATYAGISSATITLEDDRAPTATAVGGSLAGTDPVQGTQTLAITASDTGSGVYQAILEVDGREAQARTIDVNGGHCQNVGQTTDGRQAFLYVQPCKLEVNDQYVSFDLSVIPDGPHRLTVLVTDAAGNATAVLDRVVVVGRGACNGTCDDQATISPSDPRLLKAIIRRYPRSAVTVSGTLREPTGAPVVGARLELLQLASYTAARSRVIATTVTAPTGAWTFAVPPGPSRLLRVAFRSHALDTGYAAQLDLHEKVYADIALHAPARVRVGVPLIFRGRLAGGYTPPEGNYVEMQIFYLGRWRSIETLRTTRSGRFAYRYTFGIGSGRSYLFRASIHESSAYPFIASASRPVRVAIR